MSKHHFITGFPYAAALVAAVSALAQKAPTPSDDIVVLPELVISARRIIPPPEPWSHATMDGIEVLSCASDGKTKRIMQDFGAFRNVLRAIAPSVELKNAPPLKMIICGRLGMFGQFVPPGQTLNQIVISYKDNEQAYIVINESDLFVSDMNELATGDDAVSIVEMMSGYSETANGIDDAIPEAAAFGARIGGFSLNLGEQINRAYLRLCFTQLTPPPPPWFEEGMVQIFMNMRFSGNDVMLGQVRENSRGSDNLATSMGAGISGVAMPTDLPSVVEETPLDFNTRLARQRLMPYAEVFAVTRDSRTYLGSGSGKWAMQCQAFIHYCLYRTASKLQAPFAKFVKAATAGPVDETVFKECFGFDYKDLELRISNYVEAIDAQVATYRFKEDTRPKPPEVREARDSEVGRMKGEALRIAGKPELGRAELLGPYTRKRVDPELLAALGLDELTQGTQAKAQSLLEAAVKGKVVRPLAYVVLGRIYLAEWTEGENSEKKLNPQQLLAIQNLVLAARTQFPSMSAVYMLYADALAAAGAPSSAEQLSVLVEGCKAYPGNLDLVYKTARLIIDSGERAGALPLVQFGIQSSRTADDKERFESLSSAAETVK